MTMETMGNELSVNKNNAIQWITQYIVNYNEQLHQGQSVKYIIDIWLNIATGYLSRVRLDKTLQLRIIDAGFQIHFNWPCLRARLTHGNGVEEAEEIENGESRLVQVLLIFHCVALRRYRDDHRDNVTNPGPPVNGRTPKVELVRIMINGEQIQSLDGPKQDKEGRDQLNEGELVSEFAEFLFKLDVLHGQEVGVDSVLGWEGV